ncbi:carboxylesterase family protein|uniref:Carboxylesterase family protein n=1 Tax=Leuconostoc lactis TaxID=1246 RepID=A0A6L7A8J7_LEULA|nr:carboxylesterase family protein [Leuconostoc lactis]
MQKRTGDPVPTGFYYQPGVADDNLALHDLITALTWVKDNIAVFGGDPDQITVAGQSVGAWYALALFASPMASQLINRIGYQSEDAFRLNVWTTGSQTKKPVLFWIHGGGFLTGGGALPWYNGQSLAENGDIVVVTVNYRLGALGHLQLLGKKEGQTHAFYDIPYGQFAGRFKYVAAPNTWEGTRLATKPGPIFNQDINRLGPVMGSKPEEKTA